MTTEGTIPELTLDPLNQEAETAAAVAEEVTAEPYRIEDADLSPEELKAIDEFAEKIDITNTNMVLQYGSAAQKKLADFSDTALNNVRTKDLGATGEMLSNLILQLKGFDATNEKGLKGLFKKTTNSIAALKARYDKAEANVDKITEMLEDHQITLLKDIAVLDQMYEKNLINYKELTMYILAGKKKLQQARQETLQELIEKAKQSNDPEDSQKANDYAAMCDRFEKKLHDLQLTRIVAIQMSPQIRLVQNNDSMMAEKIQTTIANTIPLWKSQMVLALGMAHSQQALKAEHEVNEMTNQLLKKNAEALKTGTIETAKESERSIIDIETVRHTNQMLIETFDEVIRIQNEGHERRMAAEQELAKIEGELRAKLQEIRK